MIADPSRPKKRRKRRAAIIDAAAAVFAAKGYHQASTTDIAERLGMRQGSLYYYFESKEAALAEVCEIGVGDYVQNLGAIVAAEMPAVAKVRAMVRAHMQPFHSRADYVRVFLRDRSSVPLPWRRRIAELSRDYECLLERILEEGRLRGELAAALDPRIAALAIIGMCNAAAFLYDPQRNGPIEAFADKYADLAVFGTMGRR